MNTHTSSDWIDAFNRLLKLKSFEQFSLLLFDPATSGDNTQRNLLHSILFNDHKSVSNWSAYISYCSLKFPDKKLQLQRLVSKALEVIDENSNKNDIQYLSIHMQLADLKLDLSDASKQYQLIWKRDIGRKFSSLYIAWSAVEKELNGISGAIDVLQKGLLCNAKPRHQIKSLLVDINKELQASSGSGNILDQQEDKLEKSNTLSSDVSRVLLTKEPKTLVPVLKKANRSDSLGKCQRVTTSLTSQVSENNLDKQPALKKLFNQSTSSPAIRSIRKDFPQNELFLDRVSKVFSGNGSEIDNIREQNYPDLEYKQVNFKLSPKISTGYSMNDNSALSSRTLMKGSSVDVDSVIAESQKFMIDSDDDSTVLNNTVLLPKLDELRTLENKVESKDIQINSRKSVSFAQKSISSSSAVKRKRKYSESGDVVLTNSDLKHSIKTSNTHSSSDSDPNETVQLDIQKPLALQDSNSRVVVNGKNYYKLSVLGKGGSSTVFRVVTEDFQSIYAYKRVDIKSSSCENADSVFENYINEIELLRKLKSSKSIIELIDAEVNRKDLHIAMIMEAGDSDLAKVLLQNQKDIQVSSSSGLSTSKNIQKTLSPFFVRLVWQEILTAVNDIHDQRIVHGDLKPANFVFVKGHLKLIDFGIAKAISNDTTNIYRESQIGTVNYMAPEAIAPTGDKETDMQNRMRLGRASDIWSLGCILYQIIYGKPPFSHLNTIQKLHAIPNPKYIISFPPHEDYLAVDVIKLCLQRNPSDRPQINGDKGLLSHQFLCPYSPKTYIETKDEKLIREIVDRIIREKFSNNNDNDLSSRELEDEVLRELSTVNNQTSEIVKRTSLASSSLTDENTDSLNTTAKLSGITPPSYSDDTNNVVFVSKLAKPDMKYTSSKETIKLCNEDKDLDAPRSAVTVNVSKRKPLQTLPLTLQDQILNRVSSLEPAQSSSRASKWMRENMPKKEDLRSALERRIGLIRQFTDPEQDNITAHDFTEGNSFF